MGEFRNPSPFDTNHHLQQVEANILFFMDEVADWKAVRKEQREENNRALFLVPMVKEGKRHDVVWLERTVVNPDTAEKIVVHHAACKCIAGPECRDDSTLAAMFECEVWKDGVITRADQVRAEQLWGIDQMLQRYIEIDEVDHTGLMPRGLGLDPVDEAILHHLRVVTKHPAYWAGNITGGAHELPLLSVVTGHELPELADHAHILEEKGYVEVSGDQTISLAA